MNSSVLIIHIKFNLTKILPFLKEYFLLLSYSFITLQTFHSFVQYHHTSLPPTITLTIFIRFLGTIYPGNKDEPDGSGHDSSYFDHTLVLIPSICSFIWHRLYVYLTTQLTNYKSTILIFPMFCFHITFRFTKRNFVSHITCHILYKCITLWRYLMLHFKLCYCLSFKALI